MKRSILTCGLALSCAAPAGVHESRETGCAPGPFGRMGSVTFALPATTIEPADSELSVVMFNCESAPAAWTDPETNGRRS